MTNNPQYAMVIFRKEDTELYQWYLSFEPRVSRAQIGREAFECLRLFDGSLERAQKAAQLLEQTKQPK